MFGSETYSEFVLKGVIEYVAYFNAMLFGNSKFCFCSQFVATLEASGYVLVLLLNAGMFSEFLLHFVA